MYIINLLQGFELGAGGCKSGGKDYTFWDHFYSSLLVSLCRANQVVQCMLSLLKVLTSIISNTHTHTE